MDGWIAILGYDILDYILSYVKVQDLIEMWNVSQVFRRIIRARYLLNTGSSLDTLHSLNIGYDNHDLVRLFIRINETDCGFSKWCYFGYLINLGRHLTIILLNKMLIHLSKCSSHYKSDRSDIIYFLAIIRRDIVRIRPDALDKIEGLRILFQNRTITTIRYALIGRNYELVYHICRYFMAGNGTYSAYIKNFTEICNGYLAPEDSSEVYKNIEMMYPSF